jgi:hypothetical protein
VLTTGDLPQTLINACGFDAEPLILIYIAVCRATSAHVVRELSEGEQAHTFVRTMEFFTSDGGEKPMRSG